MVWSDLIFPESEIAFIVLHFGGSIKIKEIAFKYPSRIVALEQVVY